MRYKNKVLGILTDVIPDNCNECICSEYGLDGYVCKLPMKQHPRHYEVLKKYTHKRHEKCPLVLAVSADIEDKLENKLKEV